MPHKLLPGTQTRRDLFPRRLPAMMTDGDRRLVSSPRRLRLRAWLAGRGCSVRPVVTSVRRFDKARNLTRCNKGHPVYSCRGLSGPVLCTASGRPWNWNPGLYVLQSFGDHRTRRWHASTMNLTPIRTCPHIRTRKTTALLSDKRAQDKI